MGIDRIERIHVAPDSGDPMEERDEGEAVAGRGLRNIVYRRVPNDEYDKEEIGESLSAAIVDHEKALAEELGSR